MTMPRELVFVRHGESEANIAQRKNPEISDPAYKDLVNARADWRHRLTPRGIEQAKAAGDWLRDNLGGLATFDVRYFSPFVRTRETAGYLSGQEDVKWTHEDRMIERDWGMFGRLSREEQEAMYPEMAREKKLNPWYARLTGGESLMDVYARVRDMQATLAREYPEGKVLFVTHGDTMNVWRYALERMLPEEWETLDRDSERTFDNCSILHYTRVNPENPADVREKLHWRRLIHTVRPDESPDAGAWVELPKRRRFSASELLAQVQISSPLLDEWNAKDSEAKKLTNI